MERSVINDANAPNPIGSYNQAVVANGFVFTAGQIAIDPSNGELVDGSFKDRVDQVFKNLSAILERAGTDLSKVVKFTVFLTDMAQYSDVNDVFNKSSSIENNLNSLDEKYYKIKETQEMIEFIKRSNKRGIATFSNE